MRSNRPHRRRLNPQQQIELPGEYRISPIPILIIVGVLFIAIPVVAYYSYQHQKDVNVLSEQATRIACETWSLAQMDRLNLYSSTNLIGLQGVSLQEQAILNKLQENKQLALNIKAATESKKFAKGIRARVEYVCGANKRHMETFFRAVERVN